MVAKYKRIMYLSNSYPHTVSGVSTVVNNLLMGMKNAYEVAVICPNTTTRYTKRIITGVTHYFLPSYPTLIRKDVRFITPNPLQLQKAFDDFMPQLIHMHDPSPASMVLKEIAVKSEIPIIFSHHFTPQMVLGYLPDGIKTAAQNNESLNKAILQITCKLYENATTIIVPTHTVRTTLQTCTNIPIQIISSGIDNNFIQQAKVSHKSKSHPHRLPDKPFAFYAGRLDPEKNLTVLLNAWKEVLKKTNKYSLVIAGEGSVKNKLHDLAHTLDIDETIIWTGLIPSNELPLLYTHPQARVFVITSSIESQSIVTLMALAAKLPVVAANAGALPELVTDKENGYLCDPDNAIEIGEKILYLLDNPHIAARMGQVGSKIAKKHDLENVIEKYHKLYEKTILLDHSSHT